MPASPAFPALSRRAALALCLGGLAAPRAAFAAGDDATAGLRIALAGRQRMLAQQTLANAALARIEGGNDAPWLPRMRAARAEFDATHRRLMDGDLAGPLAPEENPGVRAALAATESAWRGVSVPAGRAIAAGAVTDETIAALLEMEAPLEQATDTAAAVHVSSYGAGALPMSLAITISIADRQRALIAATAKHAAFGALGDASRPAQAAKVAELATTTQAALLDGMPMAGVIAAPSPEIRDALAAAGAAWEACLPLTAALASGGPAAAIDLAAAADAPIERFDAAVALYVDHSARAV